MLSCRYKNLWDFKYMSAAFLPTIFVPIIGLIFPFVTLGLFFSYIEKDKIS